MYKNALEKHLEKIGGLDRLRSLKSVYIEGTLAVKRSGLSGPYKEWKKYDGDTYYHKLVYDLGVYKETTGFIEGNIWKKDISNQVTNITRDSLIQEYLFKRDLDVYRFFDLNDDAIHITLEEEKEHHIISLNYTNYNLKAKLFIHKTTRLLDKRIEEKPDQKEITTFADYRNIDGLWLPFALEIDDVTNSQITTVEISKYSFEAISKDVFKMPPNKADDFKFDNEKKAENIPLQFLDGHLYIDVLVNGVEGKFIIDSGAGKSVLDRQFCDQHQLEKKGDLKAHGLGDESEVMSFVSSDTLSFKGVTLKNQVFVAINLSHMFIDTIGIKVDGLLGFDFFSRFITKIDYAKERLSIYDPSNFIYQGEGSVIPFEIKDNLINIPLTIDDEYTCNWTIDTGASNLSFHYPFAKENDFHTRKGLFSTVSGVGGKHLFKTVRFKKIQIGHFTIDQPLISFPDNEVKGAFAAKTVSGNLGNYLLKHFVVYFDYSKNQLIVEKGDHFNQTFPENQTGIGIGVNNTSTDGNKAAQSFYIRKISPESIAEKAKLKKGDILVAINGKPITDFKDIFEIKDQFELPFGTNMQLVVNRNGEEIEIRFTLKKVI